MWRGHSKHFTVYCILKHSFFIRGGGQTIIFIQFNQNASFLRRKKQPIHRCL